GGHGGARFRGLCVFVGSDQGNLVSGVAVWGEKTMFTTITETQRGTFLTLFLSVSVAVRCRFSSGKSPWRANRGNQNQKTEKSLQRENLED
ncbi:MAG: hypothetical protein ABR992_19760, partial [Solirubrobacteraceae bacterium]